VVAEKFPGALNVHSLVPFKSNSRIHKNKYRTAIIKIEMVFGLSESDGSEGEFVVTVAAQGVLASGPIQLDSFERVSFVGKHCPEYRSADYGVTKTHGVMIAGSYIDVPPGELTPALLDDSASDPEISIAAGQSGPVGPRLLRYEKINPFESA